MFFHLLLIPNSGYYYLNWGYSKQIRPDKQILPVYRDANAIPALLVSFFKSD